MFQKLCVPPIRVRVLLVVLSLVAHLYSADTCTHVRVASEPPGLRTQFNPIELLRLITTNNVSALRTHLTEHPEDIDRPLFGKPDRSKWDVATYDTPLWYATFLNKPELVITLLDFRASATLGDTVRYRDAPIIDSPLVMAAARGWVNIVALLLKERIFAPPLLENAQHAAYARGSLHHLRKDRELCSAQHLECLVLLEQALNPSRTFVGEEMLLLRCKNRLRNQLDDFRHLVCASISGIHELLSDETLWRFE